MKILVLILSSVLVLYAQELDFFDEEVSEAIFTTKERTFTSRLKMQYENEMENNSENKTAIFYQNFHHDNFFIDYDVSSDFKAIKLNVKELYRRIDLASDHFLEMGRINIREGVARGYNATDYFKGGGLIFDSLIPSERRENRLGTLLVQSTLFLDRTTLKMLYAPRISVKKNKIWSDKEKVGLLLDTTNYKDRASLYMDLKLYDGLSSSWILHHNEEGLNVGLNLSFAVDNWIFYNECNLKHAQKSISKSIEALRLSEAVKKVFDAEQNYIYQGSLGLSYTSDNNIVSTIEYIINSGGMDKLSWNRYFELQDNKAFKNQLLAIRKHHQVNEEQISQETLFTQININALKPGVDMHLLAFINPQDTSALGQIEMQYSAQKDLIISLSARRMFGQGESEYGSFGRALTMVAKFEYYF